MRAVIIGTDLIKDANGNYRVLEINTNTDVHSSIVDELDWDGFKNILTTNGIDDVHFIYSRGNILRRDITQITINEKFELICSELSINYQNYELENNSITIPNIEDSPNKLIIRTAYDGTAFVDDEFTKDKINFNKLIRSKDYSTKYYYNSNIDMGLCWDGLTELHVTADDTPNYILKTRFPNENYVSYPKLYKINTIESLNELKNSLTHTEYLEEFYIHPDNFVNDKISVIRSLDIFYGGSLSTFNLGAYRMSSTIPFNTWPSEYDTNNEANQQTRALWLTKFSSPNQFDYFLDEDTSIIASDGSILSVNNILTNTKVKTLTFDWIPDSPSPDVTSPDYSVPMVTTGSYVNDINTFGTTETTVIELVGKNIGVVMLSVVTETGLTWDDTINSLIMIRNDDSDSTTLCYLNRCKIGDSIVFYNYSTNQLESQKIVSLTPKYVSMKIYDLDVEQSDIFLPVIDEVNTLALIQHNACFYGSCPYYLSCSSYACNTCITCSGGGIK